jgi:hypothetical protein
MGTVKRRSGVPKAPIDDRAPHIWIVITYEREWEQGRSLQVIVRRGRQGAMAQAGAARRARGGAGRGTAGAGRGSGRQRQRHGRGGA